MAASILPPGRGRRSNLLYLPDYIINNDSAEMLTGCEKLKINTCRRQDYGTSCSPCIVWVIRLTWTEYKIHKGTTVLNSFKQKMEELQEQKVLHSGLFCHGQFCEYYQVQQHLIHTVIGLLDTDRALQSPFEPYVTPGNCTVLLCVRTAVNTIKSSRGQTTSV